MTNTAFAGLAIWIAAARKDLRLASALGLVIHIAFLAALVAAPAYGETMRPSEGGALTIGGINIAVVIMVVATIGLLTLFIRSFASTGQAPQTDKVIP